jgi:hypothetical protein
LMNAKCRVQNAKVKIKRIYHGLRPYRNFAIFILKFDL